MDDRRLTLIVVPHGDLETRTFEIPYAKLRLALGIVVAMVLVVAFIVATWFPVAAQASRVPALVEELETLDSEREKVVELAQTLAMVEAQYERVRQMLGANAPSADSALVLPPIRSSDSPEASGAGTGFVWPVQVQAGSVVTRSQRPPARPGEHPGLDITVPPETQIRAVAAGLVKEARESERYGKYILIDHGGGLETLYGNASRLVVREGDRVSRGQYIALSGSAGRSPSHHLHFEIRQEGRAVDPLLYVRQP